MNSAFESIRKGLLEAAEYAEGNKDGTRVHYVPKPDAEGIRNKIGMSRKQFAAKLGVSLNTLISWEKGIRNPKGPALILFDIIDKYPQTVLNLLSGHEKSTSAYSGL